jgi:hypothetical protein
MKESAHAESEEYTSRIVREVVFCDLLHATAHVFPVTLPRKLMAEKSEPIFDKNLISRNHFKDNENQAFVPERSKGVHSSCTVFALVGSNPTECMVSFFDCQGWSFQLSIII